MKKNESINIVGYDVVASAVCDFGSVLVLSNNCDAYLVVETESQQDNVHASGHLTSMFNVDARLVAKFEHGATFSAAYRQALDKMTSVALAHTSDDGDVETVDELFAADPEACPSCGKKPGEGFTDGCVDPNGCGFYRNEGRS